MRRQAPGQGSAFRDRLLSRAHCRAADPVIGPATTSGFPHGHLSRRSLSPCPRSVVTPPRTTRPLATRRQAQWVNVSSGTGVRRRSLMSVAHASHQSMASGSERCAACKTAQHRRRPEHWSLQVPGLDISPSPTWLAWDRSPRHAWLWGTCATESAAAPRSDRRMPQHCVCNGRGNSNRSARATLIGGFARVRISMHVSLTFLMSVSTASVRRSRSAMRCLVWLSIPMPPFAPVGNCGGASETRSFRRSPTVPPTRRQLS